jgi:NAD-dependent histone deacetylase SIR2
MRPTPPASDNDGASPRKKRKLTDPKERSTERLDLSKDDVADDAVLKRLLDVLHKKRKIVIIAGAGISVSAGIPDFRSADGLFKNLRKEHKLKSSGKDLFDASVYQDDSSTSTFHDMVRSLSQKTKGAEPTLFHHLIATLAQQGRLLRLYSQNVDGIDTSLPPLKTEVPFPKKGPWPKTVQLHGGLDFMVCSKCHELADFDAEKFNGPVPPACDRCRVNDEVRQVAEKRSHGIGCLRPRMVLYNEHNPDAEAIGSCTSADLRTRPDAVIVAGTTLKVPGVRRIVREMCAVVRDRRDGVAIWINNDPEPVGKDLANSWDIVVKGPCDEVARHAAMSRWDAEYKEVTDEELARTKEKQKPEVRVPTSMSTPKKNTAYAHVQGHILTPAQSPRINPQTSIEEEPGTPSKTNSKKRKADSQPAAAKKVPTKRQPRKAGGTKRKTTSENQKPITDTFGVSKASTLAKSAKPVAKATVFDYDTAKKENDYQFVNFGTGLDTINVAPIADSAPLPRTTGQVTSWKALDLSPYDLRNNARPETEPFTSAPSTPITPRHFPVQMTRLEDQIQEELIGQDVSRPSTASSQRGQTTVPSSVPRGLRHCIDM